MVRTYKAKQLLRENEHMLELRAEGAIFCVKDEDVILFVAENAAGISVTAERNGKVTLCGQGRDLSNLVASIRPHHVDLTPLAAYAARKK